VSKFSARPGARETGHFGLLRTEWPIAVSDSVPFGGRLGVRLVLFGDFADRLAGEGEGAPHPYVFSSAPSV
jgi:hypothetical protein